MVCVAPLFRLVVRRVRTDVARLFRLAVNRVRTGDLLRSSQVISDRTEAYLAKWSKSFDLSVPTGGLWIDGEIRPTCVNHCESQRLQPTATCENFGFKELCVLTLFTPSEIPPPSPSLTPPLSFCCLKRLKPEGCQGRRRHGGLNLR